MRGARVTRMRPGGSPLGSSLLSALAPAGTLAVGRHHRAPAIRSDCLGQAAMRLALPNRKLARCRRSAKRFFRGGIAAEQQTRNVPPDPGAFPQRSRRRAPASATGSAWPWPISRMPRRLGQQPMEIGDQAAVGGKAVRSAIQSHARFESEPPPASDRSPKWGCRAGSGQDQVEIRRRAQRPSPRRRKRRARSSEDLAALPAASAAAGERSTPTPKAAGNSCQGGEQQAAGAGAEIEHAARWSTVRERIQRGFDQRFDSGRGISVAAETAKSNSRIRDGRGSGRAARARRGGSAARRSALRRQDCSGRAAVPRRRCAARARATAVLRAAGCRCRLRAAVRRRAAARPVSPRGLRRAVVRAAATLRSSR